MAIDVVGYSQLMQRGGEAVVAALNTVLRSVVRPAVAAAAGEIVKLTGDGALARFTSARAAILCAESVQRQMASQTPIAGLDQAITLRIGVHAGDTWITGDDMFGDAVNIAARLEGAARPGNALVSGVVVALAGSDLPVALTSEGTHRFKGITTPIDTYSLDLKAETKEARRAQLLARQQVRFCHSADGTMLAWAELGSGTPVVRAPAWITHLEQDDLHPGNGLWNGTLSARHRLIRFDARGNGLSQREIGQITFDQAVADLAAVFDAAEVECGHILAISQGGAVAAAYAARYPDRVASITMIGSYAQGRSRRSEKMAREKAQAMQAMMAVGWDDEAPSLRSLMADVIAPLASEEDRAAFAEYMRDATTADNMASYRAMLDDLDVTGLLAQVQAPCLVIHMRDDRMQPITQGRMMAAGLPQSRFMAFDGPNHVPTENDPNWPAIRAEVLKFMAEQDGDAR